MKLSLDEVGKKLKSEGHLQGEDLRKSKLAGIQAPGADFSGADLSSANLSGGDLSGANLSGAKLDGANLSKTDLSGANLDGASLTKAKLEAGNLTGADLSRSNCGGASFRKAMLGGASCQDADFQGADLVNCKVNSAVFSGCKFNEANFSGAEWTDVTIEGGSLATVNFQDGNLKNLKVSGCDLGGLVWSFSNLEQVTFSECIFHEAEVYAATLKDVDFGDSDLSKANFGATSFKNVSLSKARVEKTSFKSVSGLDEKTLAELKERGAAVSRQLLKRFGRTVWKSTPAKIVVVVLVAVTAYLVMQYRSNPENWGFDRINSMAMNANNNGDHETAIKYHNIALKKYAGTYRESQILLQIGQIKLNKNDYEEAEVIFNKLLTGYPDNEDTLFNAEVGIAQSYLGREMYTEAGEKLQEILKEWEYYHGILRAYEVLAKLYAATGEREKAEEIYNKFINKYGDEKEYAAEGKRVLAQHHEQNGEPEKALSIYQELVQAEQNPDLAAGLYNSMGFILLNQQKYIEAEKNYQELMAKFPDSEKAQINGKTGLAQVADRQENIDAAVKIYEDLIHDYPKYEGIFDQQATLAELYTRQGQYDKAQRVYKKMTSGDDQPTVTLRRLNGEANLALRQGESDRAIVIFDKIIAMGPKKHSAGWARISKGNELAKMGDLDQAYAVYNETAELFKDNSNILVGAVQAMAGIDLQQGKLKQANQRYQKLIESGSFGEQAGWVLNQSGSVQLQMKQYDQAIATYEKGIEASTTDLNMRLANYSGIADVYRELGEHEKVTELYQELDAKYGSDRQQGANIKTALARAFQAQNKQSQAQNVYQQMFDEATDVNSKAEALFRMASMDNELGETTQAIDIYKNLMDNYQAASEYRKYTSNYANMLLNLGKATSAMPLIQQQAAGCEGVNSGDCRFLNDLQVRVYDQLGEYEKALSKLQEIKTTYAGDPSLEFADLSIADMLVKMGDKDQAEAIYRLQIKNCAQNTNICKAAYERLSDLMENQGQLREALLLMEEAISNLENKTEIINLNIRLGDLLMNQGNKEKALKTYRLVANNDKNAPHEIIAARMGIARINKDGDDPSEALGIFQEFIKKPDIEWAVIESLNGIIHIYRQQGRQLEALVVAKELAAQYQAIPRMYNNILMSIAQMQQEQGLKEQAILTYQEVVKNLGTDNPQGIEALFSIANIHRSKNDFTATEKIYQRIEAIPDLGQPFQIRLVNERANMSDQSGNLNESLEVLDNALEKWVNHPEAARFALEKGRKLGALNRYEEAEALFGSILSKYSEQAQIVTHTYEALAQVQVRMGKLEEGIENYQRVIQRMKGAKESIWPQIQLAEVYRSQGSLDKVYELLDPILEDPLSGKDQKSAVYNIYTNIASEKRDLAKAIEYQEKIIEENRGQTQEGHSYLRISTLYQQLGRIDEALANCQKVLDQFPNNEQLTRDARRNMADFYRMSGKNIEAMQLYQQIIDQDPDNFEIGWIMISMANIHRKNNETDKATQLFMEVIKKFPGNSGLQQASVRELAHMALHRREYDKATKYYLDALKGMKDQVIIRQTKMDLARAYLEGRNFGESKEMINQILADPNTPEEQKITAKGFLAELYNRLGDHGQSVKTLQDLLTEHPDNKDTAGVGILLADNYSRMSRTEEALKMYRYVDKKWGNINHHARIQARMGEANSLRNLNKNDEALAVLNKMAEEYAGTEDGSNALISLAYIELHHGQMDNAQKVFEKLIRDYPESSHLNQSALFGLADMAMMKRDFPQALSIYEKIIKDYAGQSVSARAIMGTARIYENEGRTNVAKELYQRVLKEFPTEMEYVNGAKMSLANILEKEFKYDEAIKHYEMVIKDDPYSYMAVRAINSMANIYSTRGFMGRAEETLARLLDMSQNFQDVNVEIDARMGLADLSFRQKLFEQAILQYQEVIGKYPTNSRSGWAICKLAEIQIQRGELDRAETQYNLAISNYKDFREIKSHALNGLAQLKSKQEDFNGAIEIYRKLIEEEAGTDNAGWAKFNMAQIYFRENEFDKVGDLLDEITRELPSNRSLMSAVSGLKNNLEAKTGVSKEKK